MLKPFLFHSSELQLWFQPGTHRVRHLASSAEQRVYNKQPMWLMDLSPAKDTLPTADKMNMIWGRKGRTTHTSLSPDTHTHMHALTQVMKWAETKELKTVDFLQAIYELAFYSEGSLLQITIRVESMHALAVGRERGGGWVKNQKGLLFTRQIKAHSFLLERCWGGEELTCWQQQLHRQKRCSEKIFKKLSEQELFFPTISSFRFALAYSSHQFANITSRHLQKRTEILETLFSCSLTSLTSLTSVRSIFLHEPPLSSDSLCVSSCFSSHSFCLACLPA